jgi:hypothetical protein
MMVSEPRPPTLDRRVRSLLADALRFKWAAFSALVIFVAVYWIDAWFAQHGLRRDATRLDDLLLSALVFALGTAQQLRHERELKRQRKLLDVIADMNHHTRNALQVIVSRSALSMADANAVEDIRQAVGRIDWCLREVLPKADATNASRAGVPEVPRKHAAKPHKGGELAG